MLLFGHAGITLGIVKTYEMVAGYLNKKGEALYDGLYIDYRFVLIGAILPDFIDKPLVLLLAKSPVHSARSIAHSLTFALILLLLSAASISMLKNTKIFILTICSYIHLILDKMWLYPKVLLWPFYIQPVKKKSISVLSPKITKKVENIYTSVTDINWLKVYSEPQIFIPEILGLLIILYFLLKLILGRNFRKFIVKGKI